MEEIIREYSGRSFSAEEIGLIQWTVKSYPNLSRHELANTVCEFLDWTQINGKPKTIQCTAFLQKLESEGAIEIKRRRMVDKQKKAEVSRKSKKSNETKSPVKDKLHEKQIEIHACKGIELILASTEEEKKRWKQYVERYHMLGSKKAYGAQLRYFIISGEEELGCLQFSASAWAIAPRDTWIGWTVADKKARLHLVVNNTRFLVLPWVHVRNMASRALSKAARRIQSDWLMEYCYAPVLLETFVDTKYYKGTCYKAAGWQYLGQTQGRGRYDMQRERLLTEKAIYVYPLDRRFRDILKGNKPYKAVKPDE